MRSRVLAAAVLPVLLLGAGCGGSDSSDEPGADPATDQASGPVKTWPDCAEVWVEGATLPEDYDGCVISGNDVAVFNPTDCPSGAQYATYDDHWYAVVGEEIHHADGDVFHDKAFQKFTASC